MAKTELASTPDRKFVNALGRGLDVLRCFGPRDRWVATQHIAARTGYLRLDWSHRGSVPTGFTYNDIRPAYSSLGATVGVRTEHCDLSVYGHNLTNTNGILEISEGISASFGNVFRTQISTPPRTVGIDLKMHF